MSSLTPQDAGLRALAICAASWNGPLERALLASILVVHHGVDPLTARDMAENIDENCPPELAEAYDDACAERRLLLADAEQMVNAHSYADYDNGPALVLDGAA